MSDIRFMIGEMIDRHDWMDDMDRLLEELDGYEADDYGSDDDEEDQDYQEVF